jgi:hypothetical protein
MRATAALTGIGGGLGWLSWGMWARADSGSWLVLAPTMTAIAAVNLIAFGVLAAMRREHRGDVQALPAFSAAGLTIRF